MSIDTGTGIAIELDVPGVDRTLRDLRRVADELKKLDRPGGGAGGGYNRSGQSSSSAGGGSSIAVLPNNVSVAAQNGFTSMSKGAANVGKQMANLVPKLLEAEVAIPEIGPAIALATVAVVGIGAAAYTGGKAILDMAKNAADAGVEFSKMHFASGGTGQQVGFLKMLGDIGGSNLNDMARSFSREISQPGMAAGFAAQHGIRDYGAFDDTDKANNLLKAIDTIRAMPEKAALQWAHVSATAASLLPYRNLSDTSMQQLHNDAAQKEKIFSPSFQKDAIEFEKSMVRLESSFENLAVAVIKPLLPGITKFLDGMADAVNYAAAFIDQNPQIALGIGEGFKAVFDAIKDAGKFVADNPQLFRGLADTIIAIIDVFDPSKWGQIPGMLGKARAEFEKPVKPLDLTNVGIDIANMSADFAAPMKKPTLAHANAMERHTEALNTNSYALRNGIYGGGERAHNAVPNKWMGINADLYLSNARRLGAFSL